MKHLPPCASPAPPRKQFGFIEEYYDSHTMSSFGIYLGHRAVEQAGQPLGTEGRKIIVLTEELIIQRSFSKSLRIPPGKTVVLVVWPLEGREI